MVRSVARDSADGVRCGAQIAAHERQVGGLDRDIGAGAHRQAEIGLRQRGGVVDTVADHRHDLAVALQSLDWSTFSAGSTSAITSSIPSCRATARAARLVVAGQQDRRQAEVAKFGDGGGRRRLDGVGDDDDRADLAVDCRATTAVFPSASAVSRRARSASGASRARSS